MSQLVYLSLGSNLGDREKNLRAAIAGLKIAGRVVAVSSFYETEPVEFTDQPWFVNCAVGLGTDRSPVELMAGALAIEREMGRERVQKKGPRVIDIDILLCGDTVIHSRELTVPHPTMHRRRFVLEPLAEIAGQARHPVLNKTIGELLGELPAGPVVRRVAPQPMNKAARPPAND